MNSNQRITLDDSNITAMIKLAEGNPGAAMALVEMSKAAPKHDPDSAFGSLSTLFAMDCMGIYGSHIYILFNDVCGRSTLKMATLERAAQLGIIDELEIIRASDDRCAVEFDFDDLLAKVQARLPAFGRA